MEPQSRDTDEPLSLEDFYATLGVAIIPTVCDGDCGLDTMTLVLGTEQSFQARTDLRFELSDYLRERMDDDWMIQKYSRLPRTYRLNNANYARNAD